MAHAAVAGTNAAILLGGALASGTSVAASGTPFVRIWINGASSVQAHVLVSAISATATSKVNLYGLHPPARMGGDEGARQSAMLTSATLANNVETILSAATGGMQFVELEIAPGASTPLSLGAITFYTRGPG